MNFRHVQGIATFLVLCAELFCRVQNNSAENITEAPFFGPKIEFVNYLVVGISNYRQVQLFRTFCFQGFCWERCESDRARISRL